MSLTSLSEHVLILQACTCLLYTSLLARSGNVDNPDRNWSAWKKIDLQKDLPIDAPAARFIQWKAVLQPGSPMPVIDSVIINYCLLYTSRCV